MKKMVKKVVVALALVVILAGSAFATVSLEDTRTLYDVESWLGNASTRGNDGSHYIAYNAVPKSFVVCDWMLVNTPTYTGTFVPVGTEVAKGTPCTIRFVQWPSTINVRNIEDLKKIAIKLNDVTDNERRTPMVDGKYVAQEWLLHKDIPANIVFHPELPVFFKKAYVNEDVKGGWSRISDGEVFPQRNRLIRVLIPELYRKIVVSSLDDAELLTSWGLSRPTIFNGSAMVYFESDWVVSPGFMVRAMSHPRIYVEGEIVPRGSAHLEIDTIVNLDAVKTINDIQDALGVADQVGSNFVVYKTVPVDFVAGSRISVNTPQYPLSFVPVGTIVHRWTHCTIFLNLEEIAKDEPIDSPADDTNESGSGGGGGCNMGFSLLGLLAPVTICKKRKH